MKKLTLTLLALVMLLALTACGGQTAETEEPEEAQTVEETEEAPEASWPLRYVPDPEENDPYLQIDQQNFIQMNGSFTIQDGWIYGASLDENGDPQLVKARTDLSDWTVLDSGTVYWPQLADDSLFYMKEDSANGDPYGIYRMDPDGGDKQLLLKVFGYFQIVGDKLYYTDFMIDGVYDDRSGDDSCYHLYRCDLNGENVEDVIAKPAFCAFVFEDAILYQDDRDGLFLHICGLNGENDVKVNDARSFAPIYDGTDIYYLKEENFEDGSTYTIWKIRPDGTDDRQVSDCDVGNSILLRGDDIYFVNSDDSDRLYRIKKDGSGLTPITQDTNVARIQLFEDQIVYADFGDDYEAIDGYFFCNLDGSGKWEFKNES